MQVQRPAPTKDVGIEQPSVIGIPDAILRALDGGNSELEWHVVISAVRLFGSIGVHGGSYRE